MKIAWNTGVCVNGDEARVLLALGEYLNTALFDELREKDGDTYTPEVKYEPDACSGVFKISISSSKDPQKVEKKVFDVIDKMKTDIDGKELTRLRDRIALKRRKDASKTRRCSMTWWSDTVRRCGRRSQGRDGDTRGDARRGAQVHAVAPPSLRAPGVERAVARRRRSTDNAPQSPWPIDAMGRYAGVE